MKNISLKNQAISLRKKGYSYNLISEKIKISKSTLNSWLKDIPFTPNHEVIDRIQTGPIKSGQIRHNIRIKNTQQTVKKAKTELGKMTKRDLWFLGIGLYMGEGSKVYETVRVINSDPKIVKLTIKWFRDICKLKNNNITIALHIYPDNNIDDCLTYWSEETGIPLGQFKKTQIDKRINKSGKKKSLLPYGTAHLRIISNGNKNFGVMLHRRIMGWIENVTDQI